MSDEKLVYEKNRLHSFHIDKDDENSDYYRLPIESLARNGFYKCSNGVIKCIFCGKALNIRKLNCKSNIAALHYKLNKRCSLYISQNVCGNIAKNQTINSDVACFCFYADEEKKLRKSALKIKREKKLLSLAKDSKCKADCMNTDNVNEANVSEVDELKTDKRIEKLIENYLLKSKKKSAKSKKGK